MIKVLEFFTSEDRKGNRDYSKMYKTKLPLSDKRQYIADVGDETFEILKKLEEDIDTNDYIGYNIFEVTEEQFEDNQNDFSE